MSFIEKIKKNENIPQATAAVLFLAAQDRSVDGTQDERKQQIFHYLSSSQRVSKIRKRTEKEVMRLLKESNVDFQIACRMARENLQKRPINKKEVYNIYLDYCYNYINRFQEREKTLGN